MDFIETIEAIQNHIKEIQALQARLNIMWSEKMQDAYMQSNYCIDLNNYSSWWVIIDHYNKLKQR